MVAVKCVECALRGTNQPIPRYSVNIVPVENVSSYKYIGVHIALKLSWSTHIQYVIDNDNCMLGYIRDVSQHAVVVSCREVVSMQLS